MHFEKFNKVFFMNLFVTKKKKTLKNEFGLVSLFNGRPTFTDYLMPKQSL